MILAKFARMVACIAAGVFLHRGAQSLHTYLHSDKSYEQEQAKLFAKTDLMLSGMMLLSAAALIFVELLEK